MKTALRAQLSTLTTAIARAELVLPCALYPSVRTLETSLSCMHAIYMIRRYRIFCSDPLAVNALRRMVSWRAATAMAR